MISSIAFIHIPNALRRKLDLKAVERNFVGCCNTTKGYRIWIPSKKRVEASRNVIVDESPRPTSPNEQSITTPFDILYIYQKDFKPVKDSPLTLH